MRTGNGEWVIGMNKAVEKREGQPEQGSPYLDKIPAAEESSLRTSGRKNFSCLLKQAPFEDKISSNELMGLLFLLHDI